MRFNIMPLSVSEVVTARQNRKMQQTQELEARIDLALSNTGAGEACAVDIENTIPPTVFDAVLADYRAAGWEVGVQVDFRGNRQITLTAPA